jgi:hypothetical protein
MVLGGGLNKPVPSINKLNFANLNQQPKEIEEEIKQSV